MGRILLVVLLLIASGAAAQPTEPGTYNPYQSTEATMYFHINGLQQFPINTQMPSDAYAASVDRSTLSHTGCVEDPAGAQTFTDRAQHTWYGYSSPSIVEYDRDDNGEPFIHPERGLGRDVDLDRDTPAMFSWFLEGKSAVPVSGPVEPDQAPTPIPQVVVRATIRHGDDISVGDEAFNQGQLIAIGETDPVDLMGPSTTETEHVKVHEVNGRTVYEFTFPLEYSVDKILAKEGYNIRVDAFVENQLCNEPENKDSLMLDFVRVHTTPAYRPQLVWHIMNPLYIEVMHPQFVGDDLVIHTEINSPWGSYDVQGDLASEQQLDLTFDGPSTPRTIDRIIVEHTKGQHGPEYHFKPVQATWLWDYQADAAENGVYKVTLYAQNDQQTAEAYAVSTFQIGGGEICYPDENGEQVCDITKPKVTNVESPGVAPLVTLLGIVGLALLRRK